MWYTIQHLLIILSIDKSKYNLTFIHLIHLHSHIVSPLLIPLLLIYSIYCCTTSHLNKFSNTRWYIFCVQHFHRLHIFQFHIFLPPYNFISMPHSVMLSCEVSFPTFSFSLFCNCSGAIAIIISSSITSAY